MKNYLPLLVLLLLAATAAPAEARSSPETSYYELAERGYTIKQDRSLRVEENYTIYNPSWLARQYTITHKVPTENTTGVNAWSDIGGLTYEVNRLEGWTEITVRFSVGGGSRLTYHISYLAKDMVSGTGPAYGGRFGGIALSQDDWPYKRYIVIVEGLTNSTLFLRDPYDNVKILDNDPPTVRHETIVDAPGSFGGLEVRFYMQPVFYKVTLKNHFTNPGGASTTDLNLDTILFNSEATWQFSALIGSSHPIQAMYVDEENNWHVVFKLKEVAPGETETVQLELLYEVRIHEPGITEGTAGSISEVPASLQEYLKADEKWESDQLEQVAAVAVAGQTDVYLATQGISNYVASRLDYKVQDKRRGALWAYLNKRGDCSEYTDLTIAIARAAGIPARAVHGWGYQEDNVGSHAWAEFYLPGKGWQPVEPTWPDTSKVDVRNYLFRLDPIHLTRNVRGLSSSESTASYTHYGAEPEWTENVTVEVLSRSEAASYYVSAAQYAVNLADKLLAVSPDETLQAKQNEAKQDLDQAQAATDEDLKISHAKSSLQHANEVIRALGKKPAPTEGWPEFERLLPLLVGVGVIAAVVAVICAILRRRR